MLTFIDVETTGLSPKRHEIGPRRTMRSKQSPDIAEWQAGVLHDYVQARMTPKQFAEHIGTSYSGAVAVLCGKIWKDAPRPDGFLYPWPEQSYKSTAIKQRYTREEVNEALALKAKEKWSYRTLAAFMGVSNCTAYCWEHGNPKRPNRRR